MELQGYQVSPIRSSLSQEFGDFEKNNSSLLSSPHPILKTLASSAFGVALAPVWSVEAEATFLLFSVALG